MSCEYDRWVVETQLCKLRGTSDTLIGRACAINMVCCHSNISRTCFPLQTHQKPKAAPKVHRFLGSCLSQVLLFYYPGIIFNIVSNTKQSTNYRAVIHTIINNSFSIQDNADWWCASHYNYTLVIIIIRTTRMATGWFRLNAKNCVPGNSSRRFFELDHEILHKYSGRQYLKLEEGGFLIWGFAVEISGF